MMKRTVIMAFLLLTGGLAHGTIVKSVSLAEMSKAADAIVHGIVDDQTVMWNETKTRIYTVTTIRVIDPLKGKLTADQTVRIRQIGGTMDGLTQYVSGNAKLSLREEVIVFLEHHSPSNLYFVMGMAQGKYSVDRIQGAPRVTRNMDGLKAMKPGPNNHAHGVTALAQEARTKSTHPAPQTLELFKATVRRALIP